MKLIAAVLGVFVLAGCASSPEYVAGRSNYDVCRLTLGGPHSRNAEAEAQRRGLNCPAMYATIQAQEGARNAATLQYLQSQQRPVYVPAPTPPASTHCRTYKLGGNWHTDCN